MSRKIRNEFFIVFSLKMKIKQTMQGFCLCLSLVVMMEMNIHFLMQDFSSMENDSLCHSVLLVDHSFAFLLQSEVRNEEKNNSKK